MRYCSAYFRLLMERFKEHLRTNAAVSGHSCNVCKNTKKTTNDLKIITQCHSKLETTISEAILIKHFSSSLNKQLIKP